MISWHQKVLSELVNLELFQYTWTVTRRKVEKTSLGTKKYKITLALKNPQGCPTRVIPFSWKISVFIQQCVGKVKVFNDGDLVSINDMLGQIEAILEDAKSRGDNENPVSALSLTDRDTWANNRNQLIDLGNSETLRQQLIVNSLTEIRIQ